MRLFHDYKYMKDFYFIITNRNTRGFVTNGDVPDSPPRKLWMPTCEEHG